MGGMKSDDMLPDRKDLSFSGVGCGGDILFSVISGQSVLSSLVGSCLVRWMGRGHLIFNGKLPDCSWPIFAFSEKWAESCWPTCAAGLRFLGGDQLATEMNSRGPFFSFSAR